VRKDLRPKVRECSGEGPLSSDIPFVGTKRLDIRGVHIIVICFSSLMKPHASMFKGPDITVPENDIER